MSNRDEFKEKAREIALKSPLGSFREFCGHIESALRAQDKAGYERGLEDAARVIEERASNCLYSMAGAVEAISALNEKAHG